MSTGSALLEAYLLKVGVPSEIASPVATICGQDFMGAQISFRKQGFGAEAKAKAFDQLAREALELILERARHPSVGVTGTADVTRSLHLTGLLTLAGAAVSEYGLTPNTRGHDFQLVFDGVADILIKRANADGIVGFDVNELRLAHESTSRAVMAQVQANAEKKGFWTRHFG